MPYDWDHTERTTMQAAQWISPAVRAAAIERKLAAGQALFRAGSRSTGFFEVIGGTVRLIRVDRNGREAVLQTAAAGDTLAEASLFSPAYHCDAIAATAAIVRLFPKSVMLAELQRDAKLARAFAAMLARQVMTLRTRLETRNIHSARERVRHFLAVNAGADRRTVVASGTLKQLAADLGLTHEALYRTLARMAADGEIMRMGTVIRIERTV
jgi:CRP/FNR family transcriptional regulator, dissimilatory nitrate respiration regulator